MFARAIAAILAFLRGRTIDIPNTPPAAIPDTWGDQAFDLTSDDSGYEGHAGDGDQSGWGSGNSSVVDQREPVPNVVVHFEYQDDNSGQHSYGISDVAHDGVEGGLNISDDGYDADCED
ncbi:hypothetical protein JR316_0013177 [Psilocybe cubensis]|uniref:Uncharacterized protein n=2 Tax=Psilocybe cubensis TaxID=181762 RepID=A0A8H7XQX3_PSICU|nr:hypothetical protein JR316_0013177 [Psilocybe cubensis]KAH9474712.1 hypothetical protein JR316_0013177 [Psilocybe cubensis]